MDDRSGVAVVGSINADLAAFGSPLPRPGETVIGTEFSLVLGGKGANQAIAAARAGAPTYMIGAEGDDLFSDLTLGALADEGVEVTAVLIMDG
jgi:ribokinase